MKTKLIIAASILSVIFALGVSATATPPPIPTSVDQCKDGGWENWVDNPNSPTPLALFKNQGDCVSFVVTGGKNGPDGPGAL